MDGKVVEDVRLIAFGQMLKDARTRRGWSQPELGQALGVSREAISNWERGSLKNPLLPADLRHLSQVLFVSELDLLRGMGYFADDDEVAPPQRLMRLDPPEVELVDSYRAVQDGLRDTALAVVQGLVLLPIPDPAALRGGRSP